MKNIPRPEHPNPAWKRDSFVNLNGEWMFEIDRTVSGVARGLAEADTLPSKINLPFCPESPLSGACDKDFMLQVWYKRAVKFDLSALSGKRVILHFGAADFETEVYINGKSAGDIHYGGYSSFEYDITKLLQDGENIITVRCYDDLRATTQGSGKQSREFASHGCYYTRTTGIWQTVWYEVVSEAYIKSARIYPDEFNNSVSVSAIVSGEGELKVTAKFDGRTVGEAKKRCAEGVVNFDIPLSERHLWELGDGKLYDLTFEFEGDRVDSYFGLRSIEYKDGKFFLNGKSVFQRLILDQGYYKDGITTAPSEEALVRDIEISMSAGFNGARLHQKVFEPLFLYHADRLGYMVWGEYGSWGIDISNMANLANFLPDWLSVVERDFNHPAIVGWCPFNETSDFGPMKKRQDDNFLRLVYDATKAKDPTRPCIDTSGWNHVKTDIFDVHNYEQDPAIFKECYDRLIEKNELYDRLAHRQTWGGEPIFVSEYGGIGFNLDSDSERKKAWSYGKATSSFEEFYARYRGLTHTLLDNPKIFGYCYTQLTDIEQEVNGLFGFETREPKFDVTVLKEINTKKAAIED